MTDLSSFPITQRWPASYPDRLQLYAAPTPNGVKVSMMLEETGLPYEPHFVDISNNESKDPAFVSLNPNGRIPAIIDPAGPDGQPIGIWETGAILIYLADKTGQLISTTPAQRYETLAWGAALAARLGADSPHLCWPQGYYDAAYQRVAQATGFTHLYTTEHGVVRRDTDPARIPRLVIKDKPAPWFGGRMGLYGRPLLSALYLGLKSGKKGH